MKIVFRIRPIMFIILFLLGTVVVQAKCGGVDYSMGSGALALMHDYVVTMMLYVLYLLYAVASIVAVVSSFIIFYKMTNGEEGAGKMILGVCLAILFMIGASVVMPAFFGYQV